MTLITVMGQNPDFILFWGKIQKKFYSHISTIVGRERFISTQNGYMIKTFSLPIDRVDSF